LLCDRRATNSGAPYAFSSQPMQECVMQHHLRLGVAVAALIAGLGYAVAADNADTGRINREGAAVQGPGGGSQVAPTNPSGGTAHDPAPGMPGAAPAPNPPQQGAAAASSASPEGPIGSTPQTMPAKFSTANTAIDNIPLMVHPFPLQPAQKAALFDSVEQDLSPAATTGMGGRWMPPQIQAGALLPQGITAQELPDGVTNGIPELKGYQYVTVHDRIWIVDPVRHLVVDGISR
jgi:hypothetical protein